MKLECCVISIEQGNKNRRRFTITPGQEVICLKEILGGDTTFENAFDACITGPRFGSCSDNYGEPVWSPRLLH